MNVTFSEKSNNFKENIDSFPFSLSLSLSLLNLIFFFIFLWDGTLSFHSPREPFYLFIRHQNHQACIRHAQRLFSIFWECLPALLRHNTVFTTVLQVRAKRTQSTDHVDTWNVCLFTAQSHQCSVFSMSKLTSCLQRAAESRMVFRSDSDSWHCSPYRLTRS
jgi:hypothetical protein